jgi:hypothetical protein
MNDVVRALAISAGILLPVVALIIVVSFFTVRRGEASVRESEHGIPDAPVHVTETAAAAAPAKAVKPGAAVAAEEISVMQILLLGIGLFTATVLLLLALSLVQHMV